MWIKFLSIRRFYWGVYSLVRGLLKIEENEDQNLENLGIEFIELIEGQRDYLTEDLLKIY